MSQTNQQMKKYETKELNEVIQQIHMGFGTVLQFMKEVSLFTDFFAVEFVKELEDTVKELDKYI